MAPKKTKDVIEMFGEFFREAAVLVPVFFFLEYGLIGKLSLYFVLLVLSLSLGLLILGIICEKMR